MRYLLLYMLCFLLSPHAVFSQSKRDSRWLLGYGVSNHLNPDFGGTYMLFDGANPYTIDTFPMYGEQQPCAVLNDTAGNLLCYADGCHIYNKMHYIMDNGEQLDWEDGIHIEECETYGDDLIKSGYALLPQPDNERYAYLFHIGYHVHGYVYPLKDRLLLSVIDLQANQGMGKVIRKNEVLLQDSLIDAIAVTRHGNGRDWWVMIPRGVNRDFYTLQLTPNGVEHIRLQKLPPPYTIYDNQGSIYNIEYFSESSASLATFSPDGRIYCRAVRFGGDVEIYDFNRCSGLLSLRTRFPVPRFIDNLGRDRLPWACGVAISPNNRYLYFTTGNELFQYDLCQKKSDTPHYIRVGKYDYYRDQGFWTTFFQLRNAPDGKIYMNSTNGTHYLHVIHRPDEPGFDCNFEMRGVLLPKWSSWIFNYFPNYNLYDLPDSACDTLGIDDPWRLPWERADGSIHIFPNPATDYTRVYVPVCGDGDLRVFDTSGKMVYEIKQIQDDMMYDVPTSTWPAGIYFISVKGCKKTPLTQKLVVVR